MQRKIKIIAVVGPTASGKSELAVKIARRFKGEIISADSRQVYKGLNIGTGKVPGNWKTISESPTVQKCHCEEFRRKRNEEAISKIGLNKEIASLPAVARNDEIQFLDDRASKIFIYKNVPHHCIDFVSPKKVFTIADFKKCAETAIKDNYERGKVPILCGGTGFYVDTVLYNLPIPNVPPNTKLRAILSKKSIAELFQILNKLDPTRAKTIDHHNPRRLIRAIEIVKATSRPISPIPRISIENRANLWNSLILGINLPQKELHKKIDKRLKSHLKQGMFQEVKNLLKKGVSHKRLQSLGLEYRFVSLFLQKKLARAEMKEKLKNAIHQYAKRQMTWFKRNKDIYWVASGQNGETMANKKIEEFLIQ